MVTTFEGVRKRLVKITDFFVSIVDNFGLNMTVFLISSYLGVKGLAYQLVMNISLPYFKMLNFSGQQYQLFNILTTLPWMIKSSIGLLSDSLPLFGYHKRSYLILFSILGTLSLFILTLLPTTTSVFGMTAALLFAIINLQVAAVDLLTEAKYAQLMVLKPETGSDVVSFSQGCYALGGFLASLLTAFLSLIHPRITFILCLPLLSMIIIPCILPRTSMLSFPEKRLRPEKRRLRIDKYRKYPSLFKLAMLMTFISFLLVFIIFINANLEFLITSISTIILIIATYFWLPSTLRRVNLYLFLNNALYVPISGALHYFFTADEQCLPDGPHFSLPFYLSVGNMVIQLAYFLGAIAFQLVFSKGYVRNIIVITNLIKIVSSFFDIALVTRFNTKVLGIPDSLFFLFGDAVIYHVSYRLELIPLIVLTSKVCPKGMEASVYALLVSFQNFGGTVGQSIGYAFMKWFNIQTVEPCNFDGLPSLIFVARVIMPALALPLVFWLIPDVKLTDDLMLEQDEEYHRTGLVIGRRATDHNDQFDNDDGDSDIDSSDNETRTNSFERHNNTERTRLRQFT